MIGANLVAFNDITKRPTASIDLAQAIGVEDDQDPSNVHGSALAISARNNRHVEDGLVKRSLRLLFPDDQEIVFFADTDEEKANWFVNSLLVVCFPANPIVGSRFSEPSLVIFPHIHSGVKCCGNITKSYPKIFLILLLHRPRRLLNYSHPSMIHMMTEDHSFFSPFPVLDFFGFLV